MKKFVITAAVALAMTFAGSASAQSTSDLQAQINALLAQLAALQGGSTVTISGYVHTSTLKVGSNGSQVMALQACLGITADGAFGPMTKSAVMSFQAANGLVADGVVGPNTGSVVAVKCSADLGGDTGGDTGSTGSVNDGSEGSVDSYSLASPDESEALEGEKDVEIYAVDLELSDDGDLLLERIDVWFAQDDDGGGADEDPWEYFKEIHLLIDGEEVASMDADSSSDWSDDSNGEIQDNDNDTAKEYRMRFSGLSEVFESDETTTVSIAVTMANTIDTADQDALWYVEIDDDAGFRWVDGTGFVFTEGVGDTTATLEDSFTIGDEETASIDISLSSDDLDPTVLQVNPNSDKNDVTLAIYNIEEDQGVDVTIDTITVELTIADPVGGIDPAGVGTIVKKAYLVVDGDVIGSESVAATADAVTVTFDNLDWELDGDDDADVEVVVDFKDTNDSARYDNGTTITVTDFDITEIEDANGNDEGDISTLTFTTDASTHEVRDEGIMVEFVGSSNVKTTGDGVNDFVEFTLEFDVTAFGDDMWVEQTCVVGTTGTDVDAVEVSADGGLTPTCPELDSEGEEGTDGFEVKEGQTERFTVNILVDGENGAQNTSSTVRARINGIGFNVGTDAAGDTVYAFDMADYKSNAVTIYDRTA